MSEDTATMDAPAEAAASASTTGTATATQPAAAAPSIAWLPDAAPDAVGYVQNKGWTSAADTLTAYRNLEKFVGADKAGRGLVLPSTENPEDWAPVWDRLGRPKEAAGYTIAPPEGGDPSFIEAASKAFYEAGLTTAQGKALAKWYTEAGKANAQAVEQAEQAALQAEHEALARDWGNEANARRELARRAAAAIGIGEDGIGALEKVAGFSKTMKALAKVGDMMREHGGEGFDVQAGGFGMTPEGALARRQEIMADPDKAKRAAENPNSNEWREIERLNAIIAGAQQGR